MHHVKIKTERPGKEAASLDSFTNKLHVVGLVTVSIKHWLSTFTTYADLEGTGARGKLDAVLKGLVERSENERSVKWLYINFEN